MATIPIHEAFARSALGVLKKQFEGTGNALYAWEAIEVCKEGGVPVPDWVLDYLYGVSKKLHQPDIKSRDIGAKILGITGKNLSMKELQAQKEALQRMAEFLIIKYGEEQRPKVVRILAEHYEMPEKTVRDWLDYPARKIELCIADYLHKKYENKIF